MHGKSKLQSTPLLCFHWQNKNIYLANLSEGKKAEVEVLHTFYCLKMVKGKVVNKLFSLFFVQSLNSVKMRMEIVSL